MTSQEISLAAVSSLCKAEADLLLRSRDGYARRTVDLVGVATPAALAHLLKTDEELL
jgi:hypothetical protein